MTEVTEEVLNSNGMNVHLVPTRKYKTINIVAKFKASLQRETITKRALLPYILQQGTKCYTSSRTLQTKLDELYGAVLSINGTKKGNHHIITIRLEIANHKFIADQSPIIDEALELFNEIIFHPNTENGAFVSTIVDREKETLKQKISAIQDDKMSYANMRLIDAMCKDEQYSTHLHGYEEDLSSITAENLYSYYQTMVKEDQLDLYLLGDFETTTMKEKITNHLQREEANISFIQEDTQPKKQEKPNVVIEKQSIQQAKLHLGYRTNCTYQDDDYFALQVFNGIFGGFPNSKLFINVREKNSLAYYAASRLESHKGLLFVFSGIAPEDYEKAREIIELQMDTMKKGEFTEDNMSETKELIVNQLLETMDHPQGLIELLYQQVVANKKLSPEQLISNIKQVTKENVIDIANKIEQDTVYLLTNEGGNSNE
ncbi:EF-P 5-aminopentanol modification-associated protein YfmF [Virgibacillus ndiopensis]|uniref:EF-P 5-aminopentanol modification-associated protein YfmF n=1 Tax=Virgibacillus ndiopensis TaxID=2004408 RepID=UPI000C06F4D7|nr:pitrilysin family protein [Virgibacillus ndiopensis]